MVMISCLRHGQALRNGAKLLSNSPSKYVLICHNNIRHMGGARKLVRKASAVDWILMKDHFHYYVFMGIIPLGLFVGYLNIFEGQAQLADIPEGYQPEAHEYYKNPVERFVAKHFKTTEEKMYEKKMHYVFVTQEIEKFWRQEKAVKRHMQNNTDFRGWYYTPLPTKRIATNVIMKEEMHYREHS